MIKPANQRLGRLLARGGLSLLVLATLLLPGVVIADDTEEMLIERFSATGHYGIVAKGVGMLDAPAHDILLNVPGTEIVAAYLYWSGYAAQTGGDGVLTLARDSVVVVENLAADPVDGTYGPKLWSDGFYYFSYVADVTPYVALGSHTYTISQFTEMIERDGAGLMVVYEEPSLPLNRVEIRDGLDRFYRGWEAGPRGETAVNCFTFEPLDIVRQLDFRKFVGEVRADEAPRPTALWTKTGTGAEPMPADMVNAPTDGPVSGDLLQGPPDYPFQASDGPKWDTYTNMITLPAGHSWACFQIESARHLDYRPASGVEIAMGITLPVAVETDVEITKADDPDPVLPGDMLVYTLTYVNHGPDYAVGTMVSDLLPPEVTFVTATPYPDDTANPLVWNLGTLDAGESDSIAVTVAVQSSVTETFTNTVNISTETPETNYDNNDDQEPTDIIPAGDLAIYKSDTPDPVVPGEELVYTLSYANRGPFEVLDATVTDTLPPEVTFVTATPYPADDSNPLVWNLGTLAAGQNGSIDVTVRVQPWVTQTLTNTVTIATETPETDYENNDDEEPTAVTPRADMAITKTDSRDPAAPGESLLYDLHYVNNGPSVARDVIVTDFLPPEVEFLDADPYPDDGPDPLAWNIGDVGVGEGGTITLVVRVASWVTETFTNTAVVSSATPDPLPDNNRAEEPTGVPKPAIDVEKSVDRDIALPGQPIRYTIHVANTGQFVLDPVVLTDTLPPNFQFVVGSGLPSDPDVIDGRDLIWQTLGPLLPGESLEVSFQAIALPGVAGTFDNVAVASGESAAGSVSDRDEASIVISQPQVEINKTLHEVDSVYNPQVLTFTITISNTGSSIIDVLPLEDSYDTRYLAFLRGDPVPNEPQDDGRLNWYDLTAASPHGIGRNLAPGESLVVKTVFGIRQPITQTTNVALASGVTDVHGNPAPSARDEEDITDITAVELLFFRASPVGAQVVVEWQTVWELDNWGFNLYRGPLPNFAAAAWIHTLPARGWGQLEGQYYRYADADVAPGRSYYYWLEDVDMSGKATRHGPISVETLYCINLPLLRR